ncbi:cysteine proteinase [Gymnopilus junonius]|uniref:Ubiquitin carboxyl-terminal hydrolase n=1 Tax=Gymnopilus junonius TaxID=109634 RepID=A0A9P5NG35_GYMJU|nr:cysteine proteinase [Gymnopilus junonius]
MSNSASTDKSGGRWIPLESNPDIFNLWAEKAGLVTSLARFVDVYGLDDELLDFVPKPVKAVVLLFPIDAEGDARKKAEDEKIAKEGQPEVDNTIFFVKQTISNACGTIGLIHALANSDVTLSPTGPLQKFIHEYKTPLERAHVLETTPLFANIHSETASSSLSQTSAPSNLDTDLHFTCFVQAPDAEVRKAAQEGIEVGVDKQGGGSELERGGEKEVKQRRLIELDGRRAGPVDHGESQDFLKDVASLVKAQYLSSSTSVNFSLLALTEGAGDDF